MEVLSLSPLPAGSLLWQPRAGSFALTVVAKATFLLLPGESALAEAQEPLCADEILAGDGVAAGVSRPCDLVPRKARADVTLVGHAYAPRSANVRSLVARLVSGSVDKSVAVHGDRTPQTRGDPVPFSQMPLRWERAAGGPGTSNPAGIPAGADRLPNLEPVRASDDAGRWPTEATVSFEFMGQRRSATVGPDHAAEVSFTVGSVDEAARRRGFGRRLVEEVIAYARAHDAAKVLLEVRVSNAPAVATLSMWDPMSTGARSGSLPSWACT